MTKPISSDDVHADEATMTERVVQDERGAVRASVADSTTNKSNSTVHSSSSNKYI